MLDRSSLRDDLPVTVIASLLTQNAEVRILDLGCGQCRLARALVDSRLDLSKLSYHGIELSASLVSEVRAEQRRGVFKGFKSFEVKIRELTDLKGYDRAAFNVISSSNVLHEVWPDLFPGLLRDANRLLAPSGRLCLIDMERLPANEKEPYAVLWRSDEVDQILRAGGFKPYTSSHAKGGGISVFDVQTAPAVSAVDAPAMAATVIRLLGEKKQEALEELLPASETRDDHDESRVSRDRLAALSIAIRRFETHTYTKVLSAHTS